MGNSGSVNSGTEARNTALHSIDAERRPRANPVAEPEKFAGPPKAPIGGCDRPIVDFCLRF
jgi:hypothetical protein